MLDLRCNLVDGKEIALVLDNTLEGDFLNYSGLVIYCLLVFPCPNKFGEVSLFKDFPLEVFCREHIVLLVALIDLGGLSVLELDLEVDFAGSCGGFIRFGVFSFLSFALIL